MRHARTTADLAPRRGLESTACVPASGEAGLSAAPMCHPRRVVRAILPIVVVLIAPLAAPVRAFGLALGRAQITASHGTWDVLTLALAGVAVVLALLALAGWRRAHSLAASTADAEALLEERSAELERASADLAKSRAALGATVMTDPLTGLHNPRYLALVVEPEAARVTRLYQAHWGTPSFPNQDLIFFLISPDRLGEIEAAHSRAVAEGVLRETARVLQGLARVGDAVIRWGDEEILFAAHDASRSDATALAERVRQAVGQQVLIVGESTPVRWTASIGFAAHPFHPRRPAWLAWERVVAIAAVCRDAARAIGGDAWVGAFSRPKLDPDVHDPRLADDLAGLVKEGLVTVASSRPTGWEPVAPVR